MFKQKNNFKMLKQHKEHINKNKKKYLEICSESQINQNKKRNNKLQKLNKLITEFEKT